MKVKNAKRIFGLLRSFFACCTILLLPLGVAITHVSRVELAPRIALILLVPLPFFLLTWMCMGYAKKINPQRLQKTVFRNSHVATSEADSSDFYISISATQNSEKEIDSPRKSRSLKAKIMIIDILFFTLLVIMANILIWIPILLKEPRASNFSYVLGSAFSGYISILIFWPAAYLLYSSAKLEQEFAKYGESESQK